MQQIDIILKNSKIKSYRFIALLIVMINLAVFIFSLVADVYFFASASAVILVLLYCIYRFYISKKLRIAFYLDEISIFILSVCWVALQNYLLAFAYVLMGILYYLSLQKLQYTFTSGSVKKVNFPPIEYSWAAFTNVLLRDNILTLDFANNKLLQAEIENAQAISEIDFNQFAKECLMNESRIEEKLISQKPC